MIEPDTYRELLKEANSNLKEENAQLKYSLNARMAEKRLEIQVLKARITELMREDTDGTKQR